MRSASDDPRNPCGLRGNSIHACRWSVLGLIHDHHRTPHQPATTAEVLAVLRSHKSDRDAVDIALAKATIEWAVLNEVEPGRCHYGMRSADHALPVAGQGAPLVSEFASMEYAAALGMSTDAGSRTIGRALELRYRLPRLWARVTSTGSCRCGERVGSPSTRGPCHSRAPLMSTATSPRSAHSCSWAQLDRTVEDALVRFDPEAAEAEAPRGGRAAARRCPLDQVSLRRHRPHRRRGRPGRRAGPRSRAAGWVRSSRPTSGRPSPSTSAAPSPSATSPGGSSPSGSRR